MSESRKSREQVFTVQPAAHSSEETASEDDYEDDYEQESSLSLSFGDRSLLALQQELEFGFVETSVLADLNDSNVDHRSRIKAIEAIQKKLSLLTDVSVLTPHLASLVQYLGKMLNDKNFTILLTTLQILGDLVKKVGKPINAHLRYILPRLISKFGDNKLVIRQMNMKLFNVLLQYLTPAPVMIMLIGSTAHENWHVRKQVVNCITVALLTYPQYAFDYPRLVRVLACVLNDPKAKVRNCAADALSVVYRNIDDKLFSIVDDINSREEEESGAALITSTQLRSLKQRLLNGSSLPVARSDGSVESGYVPDETQMSAPLNGPPPTISSHSQQRPPSSSSRHPSTSSNARRIPFPVSVPDNASGYGSPNQRRNLSVGQGRNTMSNSDIKHRHTAYDEPMSAPVYTSSSSSSSAASYFPSFHGDEQLDPRGRNHFSHFGSSNSPTVSPPPTKSSASPVFEQRATTPSRGKRSVKFSTHVANSANEPFVAKPPSKSDNHGRYHNDASDSIGLHEEKLNLWLALDETPRTKGNMTPSLDDPKQHRISQLRSSASASASSSYEYTREPFASAHSADFSGGGNMIQREQKNTRGRGISSSGSVRSSSNDHYRHRERQERPRTEHAHIKSKLKNLKMRTRGESPSGRNGGRAGSAHAGYRAVSRSVDVGGMRGNGGESSFARNMQDAGFNELPQYRPDDRPIRGLSQSVTGKPTITMKSATNLTSKSYNGPLHSSDARSHESTSGRRYLGGRRGSNSRADASADPHPSWSPRQDLPPFEDRSSSPKLDAFASHEESAIRGGGAFDPNVNYGDDFDPFGGKKSRSSSARRALSTSKSPSIKVGQSAQLSQQRMQRRKQAASEQSLQRSPSHPRSNSAPFGEDEKDLSRAPSNARAMSVMETEESFVHSEDLTAVDRPRASFKSAVSGLKSGDWKARFDAITTLRQLAMHHSNDLLDGGGVRGFAKDVVTEVNSLRSLIAKNAIALCSDLFRNLGRGMDNEAHMFVGSLLKRAAESNIFLQKEANRALQGMVECLSESKVLTLLLHVAAGEKKHLRVVAASHLSNALAHIGPSVLQSRDYKDVVRAVGRFCVGSNQDMRLHGKSCILILSRFAGQLEFEKQCKSMLPTEQYTAVKKMMERGLSLNVGGRPPSTLGGRVRGVESVRSTPSRKRNTLHARSASMQAQQRAARESLSSAMSIQGNSVDYSPSSSRLPSRERMQSEDVLSTRSSRDTDSPSNGRMPRQSSMLREDDKHVLSEIGAKLDSSDWRERLEGLGMIKGLSLENESLFEERAAHLYGKLAERLNDNNKKVNLEALKTLQKMIPETREALPSVLQCVVRPLAANLAQSSDQVTRVTLACLDEIIASVDAKVIGPVLCNTALFGQTRVKATVLRKISELVPSMYAESSRVVTKHVVSLAFQTLGESNKEVVSANTTLLKELHGCLGPDLLTSSLTNRLTPAAIVKLKLLLR